jgi:hypothetical protein
MTRICRYCRRPESKRLRLSGDEQYPSCRGCIEDIIAGHPPGSTAAKRSAAAKLTCPHCGAHPGHLCTGPGIVRFVHAQRRRAAEGARRA